MNASARAVAMVVILGGFLVGCGQEQAGRGQQSSQASTRAAAPIATTAPAKMEWTLLPGLTIRPSAIDVSSDRKLVVFWGVQKVGSEPKESVWLVNLETGQIDDLFVRIGSQNASNLARVRYARCSPDGKHLAISGRNVGLVDLRTSKVALVDHHGPATLAWAGNRLLRPVLDDPTKGFEIEAYDCAGLPVERLKARGDLLASNNAGDRLLVSTNGKDPTLPRDADERIVAVVSPGGTILREVAPDHDVCDRDRPLLSRQGNFAGAYCRGNPGPEDWCNRIVPIGNSESIFLRAGWGGNLAISETGGCLSMGGHSVLRFWTRDGESHVVAEHAMAGTILGDEIFFIQGDSKGAILRAVPLPQSGPGIASLQRLTEQLAQERGTATQPSPTTTPAAPKN